jgi:hypothetical protein
MGIIGTSESQAGIIATDPGLKRGDKVAVTEEGIRPWRGEVRSVKWSKDSGWWIEILRAGDPALVYSTVAANVRRIG